MAKERNDQAIPAELDRIMAILGGCATMGQEITNGLDVHKMIERGFPKLALRTLVENVHFLQNEDSLQKAIGISKRTLYNHFPSKDALISAYLARRFVAPRPSDKSPVERRRVHANDDLGNRDPYR